MAESNVIQDAQGEEGIDGKNIFPILNLPDPLVLQILSYLNHDFLRHVVSKVSKAFWKLAQDQALWKTAFLSYVAHDCWDDDSEKRFVKDLKVTPFLHHLLINVAYDENQSLDVINTLMNTRCNIYKLTLEVDCYGPEWLVMLQQHPEIKELELSDQAEDDIYTAGVAAAVGAMVPRLRRLCLSHSQLFHFVKAGGLIWEPSIEITAVKEDDEAVPKWQPAEDSLHFPAGAEPFEETPVQQVLDLRNVDTIEEVTDENSKAWTLMGKAVSGLKILDYQPWGDHDTVDANVSRNLAGLIRTQRQFLQRVDLAVAAPEVFQALGATSSLERLAVPSDVSGDGLRAMLDALCADGGAHRLQHLRVDVPSALGAAGLRRVAEALCRAAAAGALPALHTLELVGGRRAGGAQQEATARAACFPGFAALSGLLVQGRGAARALRTLRLVELGPVGRRELEELAALTRGAGPSLSLRRLELADCACSAGRAWPDCRERADGALRELNAALHVDLWSSAAFRGGDRVDAGFAEHRTCDCERRPPPRSGQESWGRHAAGRAPPNA